jgi:integrase/recombinase XerD
MNEPEYIEESEEIKIMRQCYNSDFLKIQQGHWNLGFTLLIHTLFLTYNNTLFSELVNKAHDHNETIKFSNNMKKVIDVNSWSKNTANIAYSSMKKIISNTNIDIGFINKISIPTNKNIKRNSIEFCLPSIYKKLPNDNTVKKILLDWLEKLKNNTRYKSNISLRPVISYILKFLNFLNITIEEHIKIKDIQDFNILKNAIINTQQKFPLKTRVHFIMIFLCFVLEDKQHFDNFKIYKKTIHHFKNTKIDYDQHRIPKEELELMYESSKYNLRDHAIFLIMITTGMRAHGVSNIKLCNICTFINNNITINKTGRTIEKGNKWFTFSICENLSNILHKYISTERKSNSSYLFSGRGEDIGISTNRINSIIKNIANKAGIKGPHIHAHSIRHSYAHILLESGNKPEMVSKLLGHSNTQTTEQYYLKESAVEVAKRANIPWLVKTEYDPVPNFMNNNNNNKPSKKDKNAILKMLNKDFQKIKN